MPLTTTQIGERATLTKGVGAVIRSLNKRNLISYNANYQKPGHGFWLATQLGLDALNEAASVPPAQPRRGGMPRPRRQSKTRR
jgi:hypothetical protein